MKSILLKVWQFIATHPIETILFFFSAFYVIYKISVFGTVTLEEYPYLHQDLWRRLSDARFYLGQADTPYMHPPIPSLLYLPFIVIEGQYLYILNAVAFVCVFVLFYLLATKLTGEKNIGIGAALLFYANYYNHRFFDFYGMVDTLAVMFILASLYFWLLGKEKIGYAFWSGILMGIAGLTQYVGVFIGPMLVLLDILEAKSLTVVQKNFKRYLFTAVPALFIFLSFFAYRQVTFGSWVYSLVAHFEFLTITSKGITFYLLSLAPVLSIPVLILAIVAVYRLLINNQLLLKKIGLLFILFAPYAVFFTFFYGWQDIRFILYFAFPFYLLAGVALAKLWKQTEQAPNTIELKALLVLLFGFLFYYMNLSGNGNIGIIYGSQKMLQVEKNRVKLFQSTVEYRPYFQTLREFRNDKSGNEELRYFAERVSPRKVNSIVQELDRRRQKGQKVLLYLENEPFVTSQQLAFYLGEVFPFEFYNVDEIKRSADSGEFAWLLSDKDLSDFSKMNELVAEREGLKIYRAR